MGLTLPHQPLFIHYRVALYPAKDGTMIHAQPSFDHHFFQIPIAERIAQVPAHAQKNDLSVEMTPFERVWLYHDRPSCPLFSPLYQISLLLATQPFDALIGNEASEPAFNTGHFGRTDAMFAQMFGHALQHGCP